MDFHHLLLAGLPAHTKQSMDRPDRSMDCFASLAMTNYLINQMVERLDEPR
jgi:hypothetical protein